MAAARHADPDGPVLLCYDGSPEAAEAIEHAGTLLPSHSAIVLTVWKELYEETLSTGMTRPVSDLVQVNERERVAAEKTAAQGVRIAERAGFRTRPLVVNARGPLWEAIEAVAEDEDIRLIVCGTGRSGLKTALPGNLASALVNHASRALLVVPSARAAAQRARELIEHRSLAAR
jgi:nucleotide-binding universal stress UspA family protein